MRIVVVTPTPPVRTKPRPHHIARGLAARGHEVHVVCAVATAGDVDDLGRLPGWDDLVADCASVRPVVTPVRDSWKRCAAALPTGRPLRVAYCAAPELEAAVAQVVAELGPDVIHVDRERLAPLVRFHSGPKVLDATDAISLYNRRLLRHGGAVDRLLAAVDLPRMAGFERGMPAGYDACLVAAAEDADVLSRRAPEADVRVVPNGVDDAFLRARRRPVPGRITFVGTMSYPPNVDGATWLVERVLRDVRRTHPSAHAVLVGADPSPAITRLGERSGVIVTGKVADVVPHLEEAAVVVSPVRIGGGFPNKVAEALGAGAPVVSTAAGCAGIDGVVAGRHLLTADDVAGFANAIRTVLDEPATAAALGAAGRDLVATRYRWDAVVDLVLDSYDRALARARRP